MTFARFKREGRIMQKMKVVRKTKEGNTMPVVIRNVPPGCNWGWYSREDPRMHLQALEETHPYKVWLENRGQRVIEPVGKIPAKVLKSLQKEIADKRQWIEGGWVRLMIAQGWLDLHVALPQITLVAYPKTPNKFSRKIDLLSWFSQEQLAPLKPSAVELNREMAALRLWADLPEEQQPYDVRLSTLLWHG
jgi:hypothetical protein